MQPTTIAQRSLPGKSFRLISLDVLRGITIAFMILVNNNGDEQHSYSPLKHAMWNGWTATDLIFPTFLFLVGISIVLSFESRMARGASKRALFFHTLRRSAVLFLLGLVVNGFPYFHWGTLRIYGVLQRIAICFLLASALYLWDRRGGSKIVIVVIALVSYWILLRWVPVPGFGMPGRDMPLFDPRANLGAYLDRRIFPGRLYVGVRDPEGLLSTLPALGTTLLGVLTGIWLRSKRSASQTALWMMVAGIAGIGLGLVWNLWFPINKNLWTSSYVLFAAGCSIVGLAICYWAVEIKQWKRGWTYFWLVFGTNAITAYVLSELLSAALSAIQVDIGAAFSDIFF
jgi:predicted acyltransferase